MRVAALYDIHGNLPALEAALTEVAALNTDALVIGGDALSMPFPSETSALLWALELLVYLIQGNGEADILRHAEAGSAQGMTPRADEFTA